MFSFITATVAAPGNTPLLQMGETEPNDSFEEADVLAVPGYVIGAVSNAPVTETIDYFVMNTTIGREYQASLTVDSPQDLELRMVLYDGDRGYLQVSSSSSISARLSWSSDNDSHYIRVEAVTVSTSTVKTADYRLDIDLLAETPTPTYTPVPSIGETEPNDSFDEADALAIPGYVIGAVSNAPVTETIDYFVMNTTIGREYQARLTVVSPQDLRLRMVLYDGDRGYLQASSPSSASASMDWSSNRDSHYIRIEAVTVSTSTVKTADYRLDVTLIAVTPTNTPLPGPDDYEPNDDMDSAYVLPIAASASATGANFYPDPNDEDWFAFYVKSGRYYRASTSNLIGVDTYVRVYNQNGGQVASDNDSGGGFASRAEWTASYDGYYYVRVTNLVDSSTSEDTYDLTVEEVSAETSAEVFLPLVFKDFALDLRGRG